MPQLILASCFVTDFGTVLAMGGLFANAVFVICLYFMPRWTVSSSAPSATVSPSRRSNSLFILFTLGWFATTAKSEAVLLAYPVGLVIAGAFVRGKALVNRMCSIAFALVTAFYFIKAGPFVSLPAGGAR